MQQHDGKVKNVILNYAARLGEPLNLKACNDLVFVPPPALSSLQSFSVRNIIFLFQLFKRKKKKRVNFLYIKRQKFQFG